MSLCVNERGVEGERTKVCLCVLTREEWRGRERKYVFVC